MPLRSASLIPFVGILALSTQSVNGEVGPKNARQVANTTATSNGVTLTFPSMTGVSTQSFNASATPTTYRTNTDYSDDALAELWLSVGPVATGPVNSTVQPTPEPSVYAQPNSFHPLVPSYLDDTSLKLPEGFEWGVASSAYQIEGAAKDEGKGPSIWDLLAHRPPNTVSDNSTGDVVASHYWLYKQDFARLKGLGVPRFSPSISWPRIFPFGKGAVNAEGVAHYDDVIAELVKNGIVPSVTLYHWDTPLALHNEYGAWNSRQIVDDYVNYAKFVISRYDEYVHEWFTINEPQFCNWQFSLYPAGEYFPAYDGLTGGLPSRFLCGHHVLLAHATVAKWYHEEFKGRGRITFKNSGNYFEANTTSEADQAATLRNYDFTLGWFGGPWTDDGDYPQSMKDTLGDLLPTFTADEKQLIKGSCDFYAIDPYTGYLVAELPEGTQACASNSSHGAYPECVSTSYLQPDTFPVGPSADSGVSWLYSTPVGVRRFLSVITKTLFPSIPNIVVTEFGFAEPFESQLDSLQTILWDLRRADYYQGFLDNILLAIHEDGVNVTGAWAWAIFDNFEWFAGGSVRFGVQYVNYTSLERTPKASFFQLLDWFGKHEVRGEGNATAGMVGGLGV